MNLSKMLIIRRINLINIITLLFLALWLVVILSYLAGQNTNNLLKVYAAATACDGQSLDSAAQSDDKANFSIKYCNGDPNAMCSAAYEGWVKEHEQDLKNRGLYEKVCGGSSSSGGSSSGGSDSSDRNSSSSNKPSCQDDPEGAGRPKDYYWNADCSDTCQKNDECPKSTDGYVNPDTSAWCFGFKEGGRCMKLEYKPGTSKKDFKSFQDSPSGDSSSSDVCTQGQKTYYDAKVATRLAMFYAIMEGIPESCVKADLGVPEPHDNLVRTGVSGKEGRLFLCSGANSKKKDLELKWRIDPGNGSLEQLQNPPSTDPKNLVNKEHVKKAEEMLKTSQQAATSTTPTTSELKSGGKECTYSQEGKCYKGNCRDGSQNCSKDVNCGYIPGYSSGEEVAC